MPQKISVVAGRGIPLLLDDIDTDRIIPARFLKCITFEGLAEGAFADDRAELAGAHPFDRDEHQGASVLVVNSNFGCGSSREHAPWALMDFGVTCVIASSFADIFYNNCFQNGLLPVVLTPDEVQDLLGECQGGNHMVSVDLAAQTVTSPSGKVFTFQIDPSRKAKMLNGLDAIGETLSAAADIDAWESRRTLTHPWLERA